MRKLIFTKGFASDQFIQNVFILLFGTKSLATLVKELAPESRLFIDLYLSDHKYAVQFEKGVPVDSRSL